MFRGEFENANARCADPPNKKALTLFAKRDFL